MRQITRQYRKQTEEQPETEAKDVKDEQLAEETEDLLADIDCCLAEAVADQDERRQAKAEYDKIMEKYALTNDAEERYYSEQAWAQLYRNVIPMKQDCCGVLQPDFSGIE